MVQILTANRLIDGTVLYWRDGSWVEALEEADCFADTATAEAALTAAAAFVTGNAVVNPYLFEVRNGRPVKEREIIRARGPSVRRDLGKQADGPPPETLRVSTSPQGGGNEDTDVSI